MLNVTCARILGATVLAAAFSAAACAQSAAPAPAKRTVLQQTDVSTEAPQEVIFGTVEIAPGTGNPFHTHFGTEIGYVLQGHIRVEKKGEPPQDLGPGQSFLIPRGVVHHSVPLGSEPVKLVNNWVVDKGKPLLTPAPQ
jgi:quercetin dioxygenase-like cupin family protein